MFRLLSFSLMILLLTACSTSKKIVEDSDKLIIEEEKVAILQEMMTGSFDSSLQEKEDSSFYNISLHMYPIWQKRHDGKYLYVEQALSSMQNKPYRQRIYRLEERDDGSIASYVYTLKFESRFIGKWNNPKFFEKFGLSILDEREGCEVVLTKTYAGYEGSTKGKGCTSSLRGASYATSKVNITATEVTSWDQGFDAENKQVWGATKGPYVFVKQGK